MINTPTLSGKPGQLQAILATVPAPAAAELTRSMEADLLPIDDPLDEKADLIDGVLGAGSMFDDTHGIQADGVSSGTPVLPAGWRERLVEISNENINGIRGLCLEAHDLIVSKLAAGRSKDLDFCDAAVRTGLSTLQSSPTGSGGRTSLLRFARGSWRGPPPG